MSALALKLRIARGVGRVVRASGRGGGTSLPGKVLLRLEPDAIGRLASRLGNGSAVISATNGKTTTATITATILERAGRTLVHNRAGANMAGGVASTLLAAARPRRGISGDTGLFEVDEFWLDAVTKQVKPRAVVLANLFRDQLDRYGELETIAERWAQMLTELDGSTTLVLNADDPLVADLGRGREHVTYFGVDDGTLALPEMQHASDSKHCRRCGAPYTYDAVYLGHLGHYHCPNCGQQRPRPGVRAERITLHGTHAATFMLVTPAGQRSVFLRLPGLYNVYNALAATALCMSLGVSLDLVVEGLQSATAAFGRAETVELGDTTLQILLIKNPAGANEILRTLGLESDQLDVLAVLNDNIADGRDVSWIWDADFELLSSHVRRVTCAGTRAAELAVRLKYAGVPESALAVVSELPVALDQAIAGAGAGRVFALPTYTALLALRAELTARGHVSAYWREAG
ncbi:MAG TPA: MurT ligase domain-containing protein [Solirubrobacteraceae bacterium]|nr:MurT ligase domain-containing protein [Solirubrobacteraceae bacterium]